METTRKAKIIAVFMPKRRWLQVRLKTLFALVAFAAVASGWLEWSVKGKRRQRAAISEIERRGGTVTYDFQYDEGGNFLPGREPAKTAWHGTPLDIFCVPTVVGVSFYGREEISDADVANLAVLQDVKWLDFTGTGVTDAGLVHLRSFPNLEALYLTDTRVSDAGLAEVGRCTHLKYLGLWRTAVSDAGLMYLKSLNGLRYLDSGHTRVSDAGLSHLKMLTGLEFLGVQETDVTHGGVTAFQAVLPNCLVEASLHSEIQR